MCYVLLKVFGGVVLYIVLLTVDLLDRPTV